jgi:hypothetical protein
MSSIDADASEGVVRQFSQPIEAHWTPITSGLPSAGEFYGAQFGDVNNDGHLDIAASTATGLMHVYVSDGAGSYSEESNGIPAAGSAYDTILADFNNDGNLDLAGDGVYLGDGGAGGSMTWTYDSRPSFWFAAAASTSSQERTTGSMFGWGTAESEATSSGPTLQPDFRQ